MRRGLMKWRQDELSATDLHERVARLRAAFLEAGLDGIIVYTTLVNPAAVHYLTGFTPYWSDGLLYIPRAGRPIFVTALSKRVGAWLASVNPTCEILHSPRPGLKMAEAIGAGGGGFLGAVELEMMPGVLVEDLISGGAIDLTDATALFATVRAKPTEAELRLAAKADSIASAAFASVDLSAETVGGVTGPLEREVRLAGAEECYVAIAPDLQADDRFGRVDGRRPLGTTFAVRLSIAYNGVWIRRSESFTRDPELVSRLGDFNDWISATMARLDLSSGIGNQLRAMAERASLELASWQLETPVGVRPLKRVAGSGGEGGPIVVPYGVLSLAVRAGGVSLLGARLLDPRADVKPAEAA
jgi:hypothetical protein